MVLLLIFSSFLFYLGMVFVYFVVFLLVFGFFVKIVFESVFIVMDIIKYFDFVMVFFMVFGIFFEVLIVIIFLCWVGVIMFEVLKKKCFYVFVGVFVVGMFFILLDVLL